MIALGKLVALFRFHIEVMFGVLFQLDCEFYSEIILMSFMVLLVAMCSFSCQPLINSNRLLCTVYIALKSAIISNIWTVTTVQILLNFIRISRCPSAKYFLSWVCLLCMENETKRYNFRMNRNDSSNSP